MTTVKIAGPSSVIPRFGRSVPAPTPMETFSRANQRRLRHYLPVPTADAHAVGPQRAPIADAGYQGTPSDPVRSPDRSQRISRQLRQYLPPDRRSRRPAADFDTLHGQR